MDEKHIMVSLGDDKVKQISEVIGSKSCNKILNLLAENEETETDISKKLKMPLNTVGYNIKKLVKSGLIEKSSHWWSVKGKKMPVYRVSNRKIIISPKKSIVKVFAWVIGLTGLGALTIKQFTEKTISPVLQSESEMASGAVFTNKVITEKSMPVLLDGVSEGAGFFASLSPWSWFLAGAWLAIFLFFAFTLYSERKARGLS